MEAISEEECAEAYESPCVCVKEVIHVLNGSCLDTPKACHGEVILNGEVGCGVELVRSRLNGIGLIVKRRHSLPCRR